MKKLIITLIICLFCSPLWGATYYIDYTLGDDTRTGATATSKDTPWKTCPGMVPVGTRGTYNHSEGDIFIFKGGETWPYTTLPLTIGYSGGEGNQDQYTVDKTWFTGASWSYPILDGEMSLGRNSYVIGDNGQLRSNITLDNLKLMNVGADNASGCAAKFTGSGSAIEIRYCWLQPEAVDAFAYSGGAVASSKVYIHHNEIHRAIRGEISSYIPNILDDVRVYNNNWEGPGDTYKADYHGDGLQIYATSNNCLGTTSPSITNIQFYNNYFYGDWSSGATAFYLTQCSSNSLIYNNVFSVETNVGDGPYLSPAFISFDPAFPHFGYIKIHNNTLSSDIKPWYNGGSRSAITIGPTFNTTGIDVRNNVISGHGDGINIADGNATSVVIDNNLYYNMDPDRITIKTFIGPTGESFPSPYYVTCTTLASCKLLGFETNSPSFGDPKYIAVPDGSVGSGNFGLQSSSPAINTGADLSAYFTTDIIGTTRPQNGAWDIGAYEYFTTGSFTGSMN
jgi:hypothetical protein